MAHTTDIAFDIGDYRVNPRQRLDGMLASAHNHWLMNSVPGVQQAIGTPAVASTHHPVTKAIFEHPGDFITQSFGSFSIVVLMDRR